jgi:hypothetical protein
MLMLFLSWTYMWLAQATPATSAPSQAARPIGVILAIEPAAKRLTIKSDAGPAMSISLEETTRFLRVSPGAKDLENAAAISVSDLAVGDRILARGQSAGTAGSFVANMIIVISKADLATKHAAERADWQKRGVGGVITALNPASGEITIKPPAVADAKPVVIALAPGGVLRRYAPNTVKFSDARPCRFEDLRIGDQVKTLGTANQDRSRFTAEEVVAGSFRNIVANVVQLDPQHSSVTLTDLATNKRFQAQVTPDSAIHRLSAKVAQMLAARIQGPAQTGESQQITLELQSAIEALPPLAVAELKPGDAVIVTCTKSEDASRVTAITLLAGVEPLLKAAARAGRGMDLGSWNLDLNMNAGQ